MSDTQYRKAGDALILSGQLGGALPDEADWAGSAGEIHIVDATTLEVERTAACTITPPIRPLAPARYAYVGGPIDEGSYLYEVQVAFLGLSDPLTFPNDKTKLRLKVVAEYA